MSYEHLEARVAEWAASQPAVRAVLTVGSRARGTADRWSDLDVLILTFDRPRFTADSGWLSAFGTLTLTYADSTGPGDFEWFALYSDGSKLDAVILQVDDMTASLDTLLTGYPYQGVFARGYIVLFDQLGKPRSAAPQPLTQSVPPSPAEFHNLIGGFLIESVTTAKFIARGDLWRAQHWFAHDLRSRLLTLIEWHAHGHDSWYDGRYIDQWADSRLTAALPECFPAFTASDLARSLLRILDIFQTAGQETAARFGYEYPAFHSRIAASIDAILADANRRGAEVRRER